MNKNFVNITQVKETLDMKRFYINKLRRSFANEAANRPC